MTTVYTYTGKESNPCLVGQAYVNRRNGRLTTTFAYDYSYLAERSALPIDPELPLQAGNWPVAHELPGSLMDSTPDRWGRNLINRRYPGRRLDNLDYLLNTSDITRQGALRYKTEQDGVFQYPDANVPKLVALPKLLDAAGAIDSPRNGDEAIRYLLEAGSGSLGGARPKAVVEKDGCLFLAKFPHQSDQIDVIAAEYRALVEADKRQMDVPACELIRIGDANVLLIRRFDRRYLKGDSERVPYISAMTALGAVDGEQHDYLDIIDFITRHGSKPKEDIAELLRRIRYTVEINNTDDHLRNHGFLYEKGGWRLSPLFDINPNPDKNTLRQTSFAGHLDAEGSLRSLDEWETRTQGHF
jgi:serine/threonine-protein kinase HipA